jgi:ATP-dependent DNA ligase
VGRFRALVRIDQGKCQLISRNGNEFKSFPVLNSCMLEELEAKSAILDGEIVCVCHPLISIPVFAAIGLM